MLGLKKGFLSSNCQSSGGSSLSEKEDRLKQEKLLKRPRSHDSVPMNYDSFQDYFTDSSEDEVEDDEADENEEITGDSWFSSMNDLEAFKELCLQEMISDYQGNLGPSIHLTAPKPSFSAIPERVVRRHFPYFVEKNSSSLFDSKLKKLEDQIFNFKEEKSNWMHLESDMKQRNKDLEEKMVLLQRENERLKQNMITGDSPLMKDLQGSESEANIYKEEEEMGSKPFNRILFSRLEKAFSAERCGKSGHFKSKCNLSTNEADSYEISTEDSTSSPRSCITRDTICKSPKIPQPKRLDNESVASNFTFKATCKEHMMSNLLTRPTQSNGINRITLQKRNKGDKCFPNLNHKKKPKTKLHIGKEKRKPRRLYIRLGKRNASNLSSPFVKGSPDGKRMKMVMH
ncbi:hypothetical protein CCACVL1_12345 [Corchorus capsularis]|uniref:Uncharacterized protein n=1 Tax=Corchorus capsularis TaxID=210143 RepID=A0A1R3IG93_COCAP|nr:hypothetical protein CCACVL1_12345 [Corchorus capsularis]